MQVLASPQTRRGAFTQIAVGALLDVVSVGAFVLGLDVFQTGQAQPWLLALGAGLFLMAGSLVVSGAGALKQLDKARDVGEDARS